MTPLTRQHRHAPDVMPSSVLVALAGLAALLASPEGPRALAARGTSPVGRAAMSRSYEEVAVGGGGGTQPWQWQWIAA